jgi:hypothetical protein
VGIALIRTTSNREWVSKLYVLPRGFTELTTCSQVLQGSRLESPDVRIYRRVQESSRSTTGSSLSLHCFERQSPRYEDERSGITVIRNQAQLGKDDGHEDSKTRRPKRNGLTTMLLSKIWFQQRRTPFLGASRPGRRSSNPRKSGIFNR